MQLTSHFSDAELGVVGCDQRLQANARYLCEVVLEPIREHFGPVNVHDGYRNPEHNERVGGKADSYHLYEDCRAAADISVAGISCEDLFDWVRLESGLPFDKAILERDPEGIAACVHLQIDRLAAPRREAFTGSTGAGTEYIPVAVK